jgi:hypothetical protein
MDIYRIILPASAVFIAVGAMMEKGFQSLGLDLRLFQLFDFLAYAP